MSENFLQTVNKRTVMGPILRMWSCGRCPVFFDRVVEDRQIDIALEAVAIAPGVLGLGVHRVPSGTYRA